MQHWGSCDRASTYGPYIATVSGGAPIALRDHRRALDLLAHAAHDARAVDIQQRAGLTADRSKISPGGTLGATSVAMLRSAACSSASSSRAGADGGRPWGHTSTPPLESSRRAAPLRVMITHARGGSYTVKISISVSQGSGARASFRLGGEGDAIGPRPH
jgi:hypothetical protein